MDLCKKQSGLYHDKSFLLCFLLPPHVWVYLWVYIPLLHFFTPLISIFHTLRSTWLPTLKITRVSRGQSCLCGVSSVLIRRENMHACTHAGTHTIDSWHTWDSFSVHLYQLITWLLLSGEVLMLSSVTDSCCPLSFKFSKKKPPNNQVIPHNKTEAYTAVLHHS